MSIGKTVIGASLSTKMFLQMKSSIILRIKLCPKLIWILLICASPTHSTCLASAQVHEGGVLNSRQQVIELKLGEIQKQELAGEQSQLYGITMGPNLFFRILANQEGIDLILALYDGQKRKLIEVDRPNGSVGLEELMWIATKSERYLLEIRSLEKTAPPGKYQLQIVEIRQSTGQDQKRLLAQEYLSRANRLRGEGKPEGAQESIMSFSNSLRLWVETEEFLSAAYTAQLLAATHKELGNLQEALNYYQQAILLHRKLNNRSNEVALNNETGLLYMNTGEYTRALECFERALGILAEIGERRNEAAILNNLGETFYHLQEYPKSLETYQKALSLHRSFSNSYGEAIALNGIGIVYSNIFENQKALEYLEQAQKLRKQMGDRHGEAVTLFNIGSIYWGLREYQKSLNYTFSALEIIRSFGDRLGEALAVYHIGWVYFSMGENQKAAEYLQEAVRLNKALGHRRNEVVALDTLGRAWFNSGELQKALECFQQKISLAQALGDQNMMSQDTEHIGMLYAQLGQPQKALDYLERALQMYKDAGYKQGEAETINGIGWVYYIQGKDQKALEYYQSALSLWKALDDEDWEAKVLYNLAELMLSKGDWKQAAEFLAESLDIEESVLDGKLISGAEWERRISLQWFIRSIQLSISINALHAPKDVKATSLALTTVFRRKGRILDSMAEELSALRRDSSPETADLLHQLNEYISKQTQLRMRSRGNVETNDQESKINELEEKIQELQLKISASSDVYRLPSQKITLEAVQKSIPQDSALIEFMVWVPFEQGNYKGGKFEKSRYIAYILFNRDNPKVVDLGDADRINLLAEALRRKLRDPLTPVDEVKKSARELDELVMRPIRYKLGNQSRLLISPDSQINLVPFSALVDEKGDYLVKKYRISYLTSGRDLLRLQVSRRAKTPPLIIANPDFDDTTGWTAGKPISDERPQSAPVIERRWANLPGTQSEAKAIKKLIPTAIVKMGNQATEAEIKQAIAPSVIHLATHGFFLADLPGKAALIPGLMTPGMLKGNTPQGENSMLRSGLLLAGANHKRSGEEDGILTAMEMAGLNLWGTKLVVLSACETGVGDIKVGEGVYGLRRALVLAGSEAQVMSLWKVDDKVTAKLMADYYTNLLNGRGRSDALREVQLFMLRNRDTQHPYFWAAFIESGAWTEITDWNGTGTKIEKQ